MMPTFSNFIIQEEVRTSHADLYLRFLDRYNAQVFLDLREGLTKSWTKVVAELNRLHPLSVDSVTEVQLRNPEGCVKLELDTQLVKLTTTRSPKPIEVSPSVKIPLCYSVEEKKLFTDRLLVAAMSSFKDTVEGWGEIFKYEKKGRLTSWFKLVNDHDEVRLQLSTNHEDSEAYKTLYSVRVEHGKASSKLRDHDRLYLINLT